MTKIYFDAFPRSGNHFFMINFYKNFSNSELIWGMHNIEFLQKKEMITIVRNPIDSIISYYIMEKNKKFDQIIYENRKWLITTLENKKHIYVINFNNFIKNTENEIEKIKNKYPLEHKKNNIKIPYINDIKNVEGGFLPNKKRNKIKNDIVKKLQKNYKKNIVENTKIFNEIVFGQNDII